MCKTNEINNLLSMCLKLRSLKNIEIGISYYQYVLLFYKNDRES